jgi:hypothetical protein
MITFVIHKNDKMGDKESLLVEQRELAGKKGKVKKAIKTLIADKEALMTQMGAAYLKSQHHEITSEELKAVFDDVNQKISELDENIATKIIEKKAVFDAAYKVTLKLEDLN